VLFLLLLVIVILFLLDLLIVMLCVFLTHIRFVFNRQGAIIDDAVLQHSNHCRQL
jgi:hypothetical protein